MKNMKVEKISEKSYRVRKQINGKRVSFLFDHKPTQAELYKAFAAALEEQPVKDSFQACAESFIDSKSNVISPKTAREYKSLLYSSIPEWLKKKNISEITQQDLQLFVNEFASDHAPKTVHNVHGFVSSVLGQFRPNMRINTTLPQKRKYEPYTPTEQDIKRILEASKDDLPNHVVFQLGIFSLRRSEILALTLDDLDGNILTINSAIVENTNNEWVDKTTKTTESTRKIYLPDSLVAEIKQLGYIYNRHPNKMYNALVRYQKKLGIPHFRFHDLRHFFASYAHEKGISDADILATGGWKSDYVMKKVYRHAMNTHEAQKALFNGILN